MYSSSRELAYCMYRQVTGNTLIALFDMSMGHTFCSRWHVCAITLIVHIDMLMATHLYHIFLSKCSEWVANTLLVGDKDPCTFYAVGFLKKPKTRYPSALAPLWVPSDTGYTVWNRISLMQWSRKLGWIVFSFLFTSHHFSVSEWSIAMSHGDWPLTDWKGPCGNEITSLARAFNADRDRVI